MPRREKRSEAKKERSELDGIAVVVWGESESEMRRICEGTDAAAAVG